MNSQYFEQMIVAMMDTRMDNLDLIDAYELGRLDALDGKPCRPGQYERPTNQVEYFCGWREGMHVEDTAEYIDDRLDREWHARGEW